jgi:hypothetical protein
MKRAQIKMFETMGVLVVFFFLLIAAASFYFQIQKSSLQTELEKQVQLRAIQVVQKALHMPELDCSFASVQKDNCFDKQKLAILSSHLGLSPQEDYLVDYYNLFGFSNVIITQLYPQEENPLVLYRNIPDKYNSKISTQSPILLYDVIGNRYDFGIIEVDVYAEQ